MNQVGANTELIFDGNSKVVNSKGNIVIQSKAFDEDYFTFDSAEIEKLPAITPEETNQLALIHDALVIGIRDYFQKTGFKQATLGLSGGIDSAVTVALAVEALGSYNFV